MSENFSSQILPNGLRVEVERMNGVRSVAAGFLCRTGSRDEVRQAAGVSHFLEHMCFKGTARRSAADINLDFDRIGGQPNAFTSHDRTFYHGVTRTEDFVTLIDILSDMMRSTLPPDEFDMEKNVVLEEIAMANDRIEHVAFDTLVERVFEGHSLGWPVLGYEETIRPLSRETMLDYFQSRYTPDNMNLIVTGNIEPQRVFDIAAEYCGGWQPGDMNRDRTPPVVQRGATEQKLDRFQQQIVAISYEAPGGGDDLHETAEAVAAILGGTNSRFFWKIEQAGLCPHAGAYRLDFADCGLLILMAQCEPEKAEQVVAALRRETRGLLDDPAADNELQRVKNKRRTALAVEGESPYYRLLQVMDDVDYRGRPREIGERLAAVDEVDRERIALCFEQYPVGHDGYLVSVGPNNSN